MKPDELTQALAQLAREQAAPLRSDPRWASAPSGQLSPSDEAALRGADNTETAEAWEALRPFDEQARERIVARVLETLPEAPARPAAMKLSLAPTARAKAQSRARVITMIGAPLLAAAAIALVVRTSSVGPVPAYELAFQGGERETRGAEAASDAATVARLGPHARVDFVVRPTHLAEGDLALQAFLVRGGVATPVDVHAEASQGGVFRIRGEREQVFPGAGTGPVEVVFAIGRPSAIPRDGGALQRELGSQGQSGVRFVRRAFVFTES